MIEQMYLEDVLTQLRSYRRLAEKAVAQVSDEQMFEIPGPEANSIALMMKHIAGNMRSRWTDFLTSDGEKPDRQRDQEFENDPTHDRDAIFAMWNDGWSRTLEAIESLEPDDLTRTVTIRGQEHSVVQAIQRQLMHYSYHVGQIVFLAKQYAGREWRSLSIPRAPSRADHDR